MDNDGNPGKPEGLAIDDTTFQKCADGIPRVWPNTQARVETSKKQVKRLTTDGDRVLPTVFTTGSTTMFAHVYLHLFAFFVVFSCK